MTDSTMTHKEARRTLGVSRARIGQLVRKGLLRDEGFDQETGLKLVNREDVETRAANPPGPGRPRKKREPRHDPS